MDLSFHISSVTPTFSMSLEHSNFSVYGFTIQISFQKMCLIVVLALHPPSSWLHSLIDHELLSTVILRQAPTSALQRGSALSTHNVEEKDMHSSLRHHHILSPMANLHLQLLIRCMAIAVKELEEWWYNSSKVEKPFSKPKKMNFQIFCKPFSYAAVTPALLNTDREHFHSNRHLQCILRLSKNRDQ